MRTKMMPIHTTHVIKLFVGRPQQYKSKRLSNCHVGHVQEHGHVPCWWQDGGGKERNCTEWIQEHATLIVIITITYPLSTSQCIIPAVIPFVTEKTGNRLSG